MISDIAVRLATQTVPRLLWALSTLTWLACPPLSLAGDLSFVEVDPERTTSLRDKDSGEPFVAVGVNYFGPHVGWAPKLWHQFDADTVRQHLELVRGQGFNTIRVFLTLDSFHQLPGQVRPEGVARFRELIRVCRDLGIRIVPTGPDHWEGIPQWLRGKDPFADEEVLQAQEAWWQAFTSTFSDEPVILAWDLLNEPAVYWESAAMKSKWNAWLGQKYGSVEKIAAAHHRSLDQIGQLGEIAAPADSAARNDPQLYDYQLFRESIADAWTRRLVAAIRRADTRHPVTIGQVQWAAPVYLPSVRHYAAFNLAENVRHVDFTTIHFYPIVAPNPGAGTKGIERNADYLEALLHECSLGKPVMIGEFAWYGGGDIRADGRVIMPAQTTADQVAWTAKLLEVSRGRVCGWLHWAFADTPTSRDLTRWSGLWTENLELKPAGRLLGQFARDVTRQIDLPRAFPEDVQNFSVDRRAAITAPEPTPRFR